MPAKIENRQQSQFRIDRETFLKLKIIAKREDRNMNSQLEHFIKDAIEAYEAEHGEIILPASDEE